MVYSLLTLLLGSRQNDRTLLFISLACSLMSCIGRVSSLVSSFSSSARFFWAVLLFPCSAYTRIFWGLTSLLLFRVFGFSRVAEPSLSSWRVAFAHMTTSGLLSRRTVCTHRQCTERRERALSACGHLGSMHAVRGSLYYVQRRWPM